MKRFLVYYLIVFSALISVLSCLFPQQEVSLGYGALWIQPSIFLVVFIAILIPLIEKGKYKITLYSYVSLAWLRYVLIPLVSSLSGVYNGVTYIHTGQDSVTLAVLLVAYELIVTSIFLYININSKAKKEKKLELSIESRDLILGGNKNIYTLFILLAIALYFLIGRNLNLINFFIISADTGVRIGDIDSTLLVLTRQIITTAFIFLFVWYTSHCKKRYEETAKRRYINFAIIVGMINIGLIIGERRTAQLYTGLIVIFILTQAFTKYKKKIISIVSIFAMSIILLMSIYKHFSAFAYGSYYAALGESTINMGWLATTLQSYFFGTQNIAVTIDFGKYSDLSIFNLLYDFGRSIFGLSFLLKGKMQMTSSLFNTFIYGTVTQTGHVLSGIGYGYIYLGALLAPTIVCLNLFISTNLEKLFNKTNTFEMKYIWGYMLVRFSTNIFATTPPLVNLATIMLFTSGLVYYFAYIFKSKKLYTLG